DIARGNVSHRDTLGGGMRDIDGAIGQGRPAMFAERRQIDDAMGYDATGCSDTAGRRQFGFVTLPVCEAQAIAVATSSPREREHGRRVQSTRKQYDGPARHLPRTSPHRYLCN